MRYKIFKDLQLFYREHTVTVQINETKIGDKNSPHIFDVEASQPNFLEVEDIQLKNKKLEITYTLPDQYQPLDLVKEYSTFYKMEIINQILEMDSLKENKTFLALPNVVVKDSRNIKIIYRSDQKGALPYEKEDELAQYKHFILSFLGKYSIEKYQKNAEKCLSKDKNPLLETIYKAEDLQSLKKLISDELTNQQRIFFSEEAANRKNEAKQKSNRIKRIGATAMILASLMFGVLALQKNNATKQIDQVKKESQLEISFLNKIIVNDSNNIEQDMEKLHYPKKKQVEVLIKLGEFEKAYELDKNADKKIIDFLVKSKRKDEITNLKMDSEYIKTYQEVSSYKDPLVVDRVLQTETDKNLIANCLESAIQHHDITILRRAKNELFTSKDRKVSISNQLKIAVIDTIMEDNTSKLEEIYKNKDNKQDEVKQELNDLLKENNELLLQKNSYLQDKKE